MRSFLPALHFRPQHIPFFGASFCLCLKLIPVSMRSSNSGDFLDRQGAISEPPLFLPYSCDNCDLLTGKPPGSSPTPSPTSGPTPSPTSGSTPSPAPGTTASPTSSPIPASNGCQTGGVCSGSCAAGLNYCYNAGNTQSGN